VSPKSTKLWFLTLDTRVRQSFEETFVRTKVASPKIAAQVCHSGRYYYFCLCTLHLHSTDPHTPSPRPQGLLNDIEDKAENSWLHYSSSHLKKPKTNFNFLCANHFFGKCLINFQRHARKVPSIKFDCLCTLWMIKNETWLAIKIYF
jgi:hypothetical protein